MAKLTLQDLTNLQNESTAVNRVNANNALLEAAIENTLSRDGTAPNEMNADLDMNNHRIYNLPAAASSSEPIRKAEFDAFTASAGDPSADADRAEQAAEDAEAAAAAAEAALASATAMIVPDGSVTNVKVSNTAAINSDKLSYTDPGTNGQPRTITQVINDFSHSVRYFQPPGGPTLGTGGDDTVYIQRALTANRAVFFPPGVFGQTAPLVAQTGAIIEGAGATYTRLTRQGVWLGSSLKIGDGTPQSSGNDWKVSRILLEQSHPGFAPGVDTPIVDRLTNGQALIEVFGGFGGVMEDVWLQYGVYGIRCWGGTRHQFRRIQGLGIYDSLNVNRQEMVSCIDMPYDVAHGFGTEHVIEGCYMGGGNSTPTRAITVGSTIFNSHQDAGALYAIRVEAAEGLKIRNNYLGGTNSAVLRLGARYICSEIDFEGNFVDGSEGPAIQCSSDNGTNIVYDLIIRGNRFNGQLISRRMFQSYANAAGSTEALYNLTMFGNSIKNYLEAPMYHGGTRGATIFGNRLLNYHARSGGLGSPTFAAGIYVVSPSQMVEEYGNWFGGHTNNPAGTGYCQWGAYNDGGLTFSNSNGNLISGGSQTGNYVSEFSRGQGLWTNPVTMANSNFMWVNGTSGKLYKKIGSKPGSDTDGTIVGTES